MPSIERGRGQRAAAAPRWHVIEAVAERDEANAWDLAHGLVRGEFGLAAAADARFAEPDLEQQWIAGTPPGQGLAFGKSCDKPDGPDQKLPFVPGDPFWFRDAGHSQLGAARDAVGDPANVRVRLAHVDTGYDPGSTLLPRRVRLDLQRNFVEGEPPGDATDTSEGLFDNLGHGMGTIGILAGNAVGGTLLGGAPHFEVVPIRVANSVVLFRNSAIAQAFDYVHSLAVADPGIFHVVTMSMGGLASGAWADAVNALYEAGVFIVTAAGNNFGNLPTRHIVYPARFGRVVAACGIMANQQPYTDLPFTVMAGNYGPTSKMRTAMAAYTPNTPWVRLGCSATVDLDGAGTSSATPQVAAAAALWMQRHAARLAQYPEKWMRVEATRKALFDTASGGGAAPDERLGRGAVRASSALAANPANVLQAEEPDSASFALLRILTGLGVAGAAPDARQRMIELEALQLHQRSRELQEVVPDPDADPGALSEVDRRRILDAFVSEPGASETLRASLGGAARARVRRVAVPAMNDAIAAARLARAVSPPTPRPVTRTLRVFTFDPLAAGRVETLAINETQLDVVWEELRPGPVGEYLEVVDVDPASGVCYAPADLDDPYPLSQRGFAPSEADPRFHQQMVYAVAMKTIEHFERALGRVALWAPRLLRRGDRRFEEHFVRRLRVYPHALRESNAYYSPEKKALLFGYFTASETDPGENLPGGTVFSCLSHDIVAHETTHALLDGLHRRFSEPTNDDVLAFHEAFADIVALFQHFTIPAALRHQIAMTRGDLGRQNMLGELAQQFGQAIGEYGALRSAIGSVEIDERGVRQWRPAVPSTSDYENATEAHDRGAVLVAAVFEAFLTIYRARSEDLIRLATGGTGVLPDGAISHDLVNRLADEAAKTASHVLNICIRALDYCPPVDLTFGDYVRAVITADRDLVPDDRLGYRAAFIQGFRRRGIYPEAVRSLSTENLCWEAPEIDIPAGEIIDRMVLSWDLRANRRNAYDISRANAIEFRRWIMGGRRGEGRISREQAEALGFFRSANKAFTVGSTVGALSPVEVHSVRPVRRVGPDGQQRLDLVVEITQSWTPNDSPGTKHRGGCTLIIGLEDRSIRYAITKPVGRESRIAALEEFRIARADGTARANYFEDAAGNREPFALLHRRS